jgi:hypothetical protein
MTREYEMLIRNSHVLMEFADDPDPARLVARLGTASSGTQVMIRAALSLVPKEWLPESARDLEFRLDDVGVLDARNTRALLEAIALQADHPEVL